MFCKTYKPSDKAKALTRDDLLQPKHWLQLEHLHDHLETFYEATIMVEGNQTSLADHFQTLDWLLEELSSTKQKFLELSTQSLQKRKKADAQAYQYLADCSEAAWEKGNKYYNKADDTAAYYAAIVLNPTLKMQWFEDYWRPHPIKKDWIDGVEQKIKELWLNYKGQYSSIQSSLPDLAPVQQPQQAKIYTSARNHKRLKTVHRNDEAAAPPLINCFNKYLYINKLELEEHKYFNLI